MAFKKNILTLRLFRKFHKLLGITLATLLVISAVTGILLSLKKDVALIQPVTNKGMSIDLNTWMSFQDIDSIAKVALYTAYPEQSQNEVDKMDVRPSKGIVKVLFDKGYWEVQVDGNSGKVLSIAQRHSDWIESIHDGSIISDLFKVISMNLLGFGLLFLIITGMWLWYGPKRFRWLKKNRKDPL